MDRPFRVLLVSGSLRQASTNTAVLVTARAEAPASTIATLYEGGASLPHFNPDDDEAPRHQAVDELRTAIRDADAVLFSTPEYAGGLPGSFKNILDWAVGDDQEGSLNDKPVAWINASPRGAADTHAALRKVLSYLGADIVEDACVAVPVQGNDVGADGLITSPEIRRSLGTALVRLLAAVRQPGGTSGGESQSFL